MRKFNPGDLLTNRVFYVRVRPRRQRRGGTGSWPLGEGERPGGRPGASPCRAHAGRKTAQLPPRCKTAPCRTGGQQQRSQLMETPSTARGLMRTAEPAHAECTPALASGANVATAEERIWKGDRQLRSAPMAMLSSAQAGVGSEIPTTSNFHSSGKPREQGSKVTSMHY